MNERIIKKGIIIRNSLAYNPSWIKRVNHWHHSFEKLNIETKIITANSKKPEGFDEGTASVYFLDNKKLPGFINYLLSPFYLRNFIKKEKPDFVLLAHGGFLEFYTIPFYCKKHNIPLMIDMVDIIGRQFKKNKTLFDHLVIQNKKLFDSVIVKNSFEVFTISTELLRKYKAMFPDKRVTMSIPSTVNVSEYKKTSLLGTSHFKNDIYSVFDDTSTIKIFYAGTITRLNGIDFFLKALFTILKNKSVKLKVLFAIIDGDSNELKTMAANYELSEHLVIVPSVEQKYLPILLTRADILFIPEQGVETANAGFPGKTSEFLLSGKPVITTSFSDLGHYLKNGENACIANVGDLRSYSESLEKLISDAEYRNKIGKSGLSTAENTFSHEKCAQPYFESIKAYYKN